MHDEDKLSSVLFSIQASYMIKQTPYGLGVVRHLTTTREPVTPSPSAALGTLLSDEDFFIVFSIQPVTCCGWNRATCTWSGTWSPRGSQRLPLQNRGKDLPSILFSVQVNYMLKQTHTPWMWSWTDHYEVAVPYCPMKTSYPPSSSLYRPGTCWGRGRATCTWSGTCPSQGPTPSPTDRAGAWPTRWTRRCWCCVRTASSRCWRTSGSLASATTTSSIPWWGIRSRWRWIVLSLAFFFSFFFSETRITASVLKQDFNT